MATNKAKKKTRDLSRIKISLVVILFALVWTALWARAGYIQLYKGPLFKELVSRQNLAAEFERGKRGRIYDRNGDLLATSVESKSIYVRPLEAKDGSRTARRLSEILGLPANELKKKIVSKKNFVWIKRQVGDKKAHEVEKSELPGVYLTSEYRRFCPNGHLAGQLLGFVGIDGKGLEGLENLYDGRLAGGKAQFVVLRDASGRRLYLDARGREMEINGKELALTIDSHIQDAAERSLKWTVSTHQAKSGVAMVVKVETGEILALANYPFFNPNAYRKSKAAIRRNRAALDVYEPGSTMKPFLFAAALEEGAVKPEDMINCEKGKWKVGGGAIHDHHSYDWLPVHKVLRYSSNIGSAKIAQSLGAQNYYDYLTRLGFGEKTGVELPSERSGILTPADQWREFDLAAISFGQGIGATALQMAKAYLCLANKGRITPLKLVLNPASETPQAERQRIFSVETAETVLEMMRDVVQEDGTGRRVRIPGITMAGKTGTAQKAGKGGYGEEFLSSFVGLVPAENPEFLILVMVDEPQNGNSGGRVAGLAVRSIVLDFLAYYDRPPAPMIVEAEKSVGDGGTVEAEEYSLLARTGKRPVRTPGNKVPDISGLPLRRALELLVKKGITPEVKGRGMVVTGQKPAPGEPWPEAAADGEKVGFVLWAS